MKILSYTLIALASAFASKAQTDGNYIAVGIDVAVVVYWTLNLEYLS